MPHSPIAIRPDLVRHGSAPRLETPRLTLRAHQLDDFETSAQMWGDAEVTRHIGGQPFTREQVWQRLLRYAGHWSLLGYGFWVVTDKVRGDFLGEVGLFEAQREITPVLDAPELGWAFATRARGHGYATEAASAVLAWGEQHFGDSQSTACIIDKANLRSIRVAHKLGFYAHSEARYQDEALIVYRRTNSRDRCASPDQHGD